MWEAHKVFESVIPAETLLGWPERDRDGTKFLVVGLPKFYRQDTG